MEPKKTALVIVESNIVRDPRVQRQISWLTNEGWAVDTLGLGTTPARDVRDHFALEPTPPWMLSKLGTLLLYGLMTHRRTFELLTLSRVPDELRQRVRKGAYELIVFNDRHFVPWVENPREFTDTARRSHLHLDLHEYFVPTIPRNTLWRFATAGFYAWGRRLFAHPAFTTRSTVNTAIAQLYADELAIAPPSVIRNSPSFIDQHPQPVDPDDIKLLHHGTARWDRGLRELVDAVRLTEPRFSLTFMLLGGDDVIAELRAYAADLGDRVRIVPPAPMESLAREVNQYDLEVMFYAPLTRNLELALPNKLFEATQGRLGLVIGESPMMADIVSEYGNGVVVAGWGASDLAKALDGLSADDVRRFKAASDRAAHDLNAETEREVFLATFGATRTSNT